MEIVEVHMTDNAEVISVENGFFFNARVINVNDYQQAYLSLRIENS